MIRRGDMKYTVWGTGAEHPPQLFNISADPGETTSLHDTDTRHAELVQELDALLRRSIDYPNVSLAVAKCVRDKGARGRPPTTAGCAGCVWLLCLA